jgi:steroid delta-isomerase-like uncharacterized protein
MSAEQNKALTVRFLEELFNRGNTAIVDEIMAPDFIEREQLPPGMPNDREGVKVLTSLLRSAFPDFKATIDDVLAEGDKVVMRQTWSGTQKGEFMGVPATGKRVSFGVIDIVRFANGKVVEHWGLMDSMSLMQQLGAIPTPVEGTN